MLTNDINSFLFSEKMNFFHSKVTKYILAYEATHLV